MGSSSDDDDRYDFAFFNAAEMTKWSSIDRLNGSADDATTVELLRERRNAKTVLSDRDCLLILNQRFHLSS